MRKSDLSEYEEGSAELVVAHAAYRRSRGRRNPSMSFLGQRNPREALVLANAVASGDRMRRGLAEMATVALLQNRKKRYDDMTDSEIKAAARHIITSSSSEAEVEQRLRDELEYPYSIALHTTVPDDSDGREARALVRALGGLVMKSGAMAMVMMHGHRGTIHL